MNAVVYNFTGSAIPAAAEAEALRAAYLLANGDAECVGTSFYFLIEEQLVDRYDDGRQLHFLEEQLAKADPRKELDDWWSMLASYRKSLRTARDFSKEAVAYRVTAKKCFKLYFQRIRDWYFAGRKVEGLGPLSALLEEKGLRFTPVHCEHPETAQDCFATASHQLRLGLEPGDEESGIVHVLTHRFFETPVGAGGAPVEGTLLRLPLLNVFEPGVLRQLRTELAGAGAPFRSAMERWLAAGCTEADAERADAVAAELPEAVRPLQEALDRHPALRHYPAGQELFAFSMRVGDLWAQWRACAAIPAETEKALEEYAVHAERRVPVLALRALDEGAPLAETGAEAAPALLKCISID